MAEEINSDDTMSVSDLPVAIGGGPCSRGLISGARTIVFVSDSEVTGDIESKIPEVETGPGPLLVFLPPYEEARRKWLLGDMPGIIAADSLWASYIALVGETIPTAWSAEHGLETRVPLPVCKRPTVQELLCPDEQTETVTGTKLIELMIKLNKGGIREAILVAMSNSYEDDPMRPRMHLVDVRLPDLCTTLLSSSALQDVVFWRAGRAQAETVLEFGNFFDPAVLADARKVLSEPEIWQSHLVRLAKSVASDNPAVFPVTFAIDRATFVTLDCTPGK